MSYELLRRTQKRGIFVLHVDPNYARIKGQMEGIKRIINIINKTNSIGITFSNNAVVLFKQYGLREIYRVPMGIDIARIRNYIISGRKRSFEEREFFATANSGTSYLSLYIKGVDRFIYLIKHLGLLDRAIIFGNSPYISVKSFALDRYGFLNNLLNVKLFFQLSRSELFGIAVLEAILTSTPVVVTNVGGLPENAKYGIVVDSMNDTINIVREILYGEQTILQKLKKIVGKNREYALENYTIQNSWKEIQKIVEQTELSGQYCYF